jgi:hypothetical protein
MFWYGNSGLLVFCKRIPFGQTIVRFYTVEEMGSGGVVIVGSRVTKM